MLGQGLARGRCSRAVAELVQDMCEDFLLCRQGSGPSPHELQLLQTQREGSEGTGATRLPAPRQAPPESPRRPPLLSGVQVKIPLCCLLLMVPPDFPKPQEVEESALQTPPVCTFIGPSLGQDSLPGPASQTVCNSA